MDKFSTRARARATAISIALALALTVTTLAWGQPAVASYTVRGGDTLELTVAGEPTYSGALPVNADGQVFVTAIGRGVPVAGKTVDEAKTALVKVLSEYLVDPIVFVRVSRFRVPVSGDVERPGSCEMTPGETAMDAVTRAGGIRKDVAVAALQLRRGGATMTLNPQGTGDASFGVLLQPGDELLVTRGAVAEVAFSVTGAVARPGAYPMPAGESVRVSQALQTAGRWLPEANPQQAKLTRKSGEQVAVDLVAADGQPGSALDLEMGPGDELFVPRLGTKVTVLGAVGNPGEYLVPEGTTFFGAVTRAGGPRSTAVLKKCAIVRMKPELHRVPVDLEKIIQKADGKEDQLLQDGDVVWVQDTRPNASQPWYRQALSFLPWLLRF